MGAWSSDWALAGVRSASGVTRTKSRTMTEYHDEELELLLAWRVMVGVCGSVAPGNEGPGKVFGDVAGGEGIRSGKMIVQENGVSR